MRFGLLILSSSQSPTEDAQRIDQLLTQACFAEDTGFDDVWLTEHYFTGESVYNDPLLFATALAMRTSRVRIGFAVLQITLHHPVRLAVQLALLDNLSKGRVDVGVGRGSVYNEYEFVGYGLRSHDSRARMDEAIAVLTGAWTTTPFQHDGEYFQVRLPEIRPRPYQQPHPPLWRSVISPGSFTECGRLGIPILTARLGLSALKDRWKLYTEGLEAGGHDATRRAQRLAQAALWRYVYVAESDAQAEDELSTFLLKARAHINQVRAELNPSDFEVDPSLLNPWVDPGASEGDALRFTLEGGSIYGSPERVQEQFAALRDVGIEHVLCQFGFGDMPHQHVMTSMALFAERVAPGLQGD